MNVKRLALRWLRAEHKLSHRLVTGATGRTITEIMDRSGDVVARMYSTFRPKRIYEVYMVDLSLARGHGVNSLQEAYRWVAQFVK